jgi:hypothetical protein
MLQFTTGEIMKKFIIFTMIIFLLPEIVQAIDIISYTPNQTFPNKMIAGSNYNATYKLTNNANFDVPIFLTFNISQSILFDQDDWSKFILSAKIDSLSLNCSQGSKIGNWECWNNTDYFVFPKNAVKNLTLGLSLHIASKPANISYTLKALGPSEVKPTPFKFDKIAASAFDFSVNSISNLNGINIDYLEYGRADAYVTEVDLAPLFKIFSGTLKFAARGLEKGHLFTVTVSSEGPLYCSVFTDKKLDCTGKGRLVGGTSLHPGPIDLSKLEFIADKNADTISVYAEDTNGKIVLNAKVETWNHRVPQLPITFVYYASTF